MFSPYFKSWLSQPDRLTDAIPDAIPDWLHNADGPMDAHLTSVVVMKSSQIFPNNIMWIEMRIQSGNS